MKILTILNENNEQQKTTQLIKELQESNEVEVVRLMDCALSYDELVEKIDNCDKVISW